MVRLFGFLLGFLFCFLSIFLATGCQKRGAQKDDLSARPIRVLVTTSILKDLISQLGKDQVVVESLMGPGIDPHRYIPTARDMDRLQQSDVVFFHGLHLEGKMIDILEELGQEKPVFDLGKEVPAGQLRQVDDVGQEVDPHIWFDMDLWLLVAEAAGKHLSTVDPSRKDFWSANLTTYRQLLQDCQTEVRAELGKIPTTQRVLITSHDAFAYFGRAYGFEVFGLQGVSTASEASLRDVESLSDLIGKRKVPVLFTELSVPTKGLAAVIENVERKYKFRVQLSREGLYSDALGEPGSGAETYTGMILHNARTIRQSLLKEVK